jgi:hypothetical protein
MLVATTELSLDKLVTCGCSFHPCSIGIQVSLFLPYTSKWGGLPREIDNKWALELYGIRELSAFRDRGSLSRRVNVPRAPAQMGRARGRARRGEVRWPKMGVREVEIPRPSCSSRAQVGCACSRGLQASTQEREASGLTRAPVSSSSPRGQPSLRGPWSFLL